MLAFGQDLEIEIPDVEIEDDEAFVVGVILGVSGGAEVVEADLPV